MPSQEYINATLDAVDAPRPEHGAKPSSPQRLRWASWRYALKRAALGFFPDGIIDMAATLTFFTVLSLAPGLLVIYSIITLVLANYAEEITTRMEGFVRDYVPAEYQNLVLDTVDAVTGSGTAGAVALTIGVIAALWTSSAYIRAFSRCANTLYNRIEGRGYFRKAGALVLTNFGLLVGMVLIVVSLALNETLVTGVLNPIAEPLGLGGVLEFMVQTFLPVWAWVKWPVILVLLMGFVAVLYYFTPNVRQPKFRWLSPGSVVAILGIVLAAAALFVYFTFLGGYSSYGAVGGIMALLLTLWVFNIVLLLGLKIDAEIERARQLQAGIPAEEHIQLPPRDVTGVLRLKDTREQLTADAHALRLRHKTAAVEEGPGDETPTAGGAGSTAVGAVAAGAVTDDASSGGAGAAGAGTGAAGAADDDGDRDVARA